jgi:hypothetical protein
MKKAGVFVLVAMFSFSMTVCDDNDGGFLSIDTRHFVINHANGIITEYNGPGGNITIPSVIDGTTVRGIGREVFLGYITLTNVTIPNTVTYIGDSAFEGCINLTSITIPGSVSSIGDSAFLFCGLTSVTILNGVVFIGSWAFGGTFTSVTIPSSVEYIGPSAFNTGFLTSVTFDSSNVSLDTSSFDRDLIEKYYAPFPLGGAGTYIRISPTPVWMKQ